MTTSETKECIAELALELTRHRLVAKQDAEGWHSIRMALEARIKEMNDLIGALRAEFPDVDRKLNGLPYKKPRKSK